MSELISLNLGLKGCAVGGRFLELTHRETAHLLDRSTLARVDTPRFRPTYLREDSRGSLLPRAVFSDIILPTCWFSSLSLRSLPFSSYTASQQSLRQYVVEESGYQPSLPPLVPDSNMLSLHPPSMQQFHWALAYDEGRSLLPAVLNSVRQEMERCDDFGGIQISHDAADAGGGALGSLVLESLTDEGFRGGRGSVMCFSLFSMPNDAVVKAYNDVLTLQRLIEFSDAVVCFHESTVFNVCFWTLKLVQPTFRDRVHLISSAMAGVTAPLRFDSTRPDVCGTQDRMISHLVPFENFHFLSATVSPVSSRGSSVYHAIRPSYVQSTLFSSRFVLSCSNPNPYLAGIVTHRFTDRHNPNPTESDELCEALVQYDNTPQDDSLLTTIRTLGKGQDRTYSRDANPRTFVPSWINPPLLLSVVHVRERHPFAGSLLSNGLGIGELFRRRTDAFHAMFRRRAFLHWFLDEGMEEDEMELAYRCGLSLSFSFPFLLYSSLRESEIGLCDQYDEMKKSAERGDESPPMKVLSSFRSLPHDDYYANERIGFLTEFCGSNVEIILIQRLTAYRFLLE